MKKHVFPIIVIGFSLVLWAIFYKDLPAELPTHWGADGQVDDYTSKLGTFFMLHGLMIGIYLLLNFTPKIDPKKENYKTFSKGYSVITYGILLLFLGIDLGTIYIGLGNDFDMTKLMYILLGLFFIAMGNYMQQVRSNFFIGIKTPWTLSNETVWKKTHRLGGKCFVIAGLLFLLGLFFPSEWKVVFLIVTVLICAVIPIVYSYILYKKIVKDE